MVTSPHDRDPVNDRDLLAERFEDHRIHLRAVAHRILGSPAEADDAVQESWLRLTRSHVADVQNLGGWLTTVVGRVCLDMLRVRAARREDPLEAQAPEPVMSAVERSHPEHEALLADSVGVALQVVLDRLTPAERVAFVLHDMFAVPFDEVAPIVGRSSAATRQLASRARRRVQDGPAAYPADPAHRRRVVDAFLVAARSGDLDGLVAVLDAEVVLRADEAAVLSGAPRTLHGAAAVAGTFSGRAQGTRPALVDGVVHAAFAPNGQALGVFGFTLAGGKIAAIDMIADPARLGRLDVILLGA